MSSFWFGLTFALFLAQYAKGQDSFVECPKGWTGFGPSCYRFIRSPLKNREQALQGCAGYNSALLSVDTMEEHSFLLDWLRANDPQHRVWYTSGVDVGNNLWRWQGDDTPMVNMEQAWLPQQLQQASGFKVAAYNYSDASSRWGLLKVPGFQQSAYICEVRKDMLNIVIKEDRGYDYGIIVKDKDLVPRAPYFIKEPNDEVFDISARNDVLEISLRCLAGGYPYPSYEWFKEEYVNDQLVLRRIDPMSSKRITITDGTLTFYDPKQLEDRGTYHCDAYNKFGRIVSRSVKLTFGYIGQFNLKRSNEVGKENWGKAIFCDPPQHYPDVIYYWARDYVPNFVDEDKRVFVSQDGNLYFSSLETIDQGQYSCVVQSSISGTGRTGPFFTLDVQSYSSNQHLQFPNNFPKAFPEAPVAGQDVQLECLAFGYPVPAYNWTRKGYMSELPRNSAMNKYNRVLIIPKVSVEDVGEYICTANNGKNAISASVTLSIQAKPVFTIPLQDMHMDKGADLNWNCEAFGIPEVRYDWYRNGIFLNQSIRAEDYIRYQIRENVLTIRTLDPSRDQGVYQCRAVNQLGSTFSSAELRVLTIAPSFAKYPVEKETYAAEGGNVTIACLPEGSPTPRFEWSRNGAALRPDGNRMIIHRNGYLVIYGVRPNDEGRYKCSAVNEYGRAESEGYIYVLRSPTFVTRPPQSQIALVNQTVRLDCRVQSPSVLDLSYIWLSNGIRVDEFGHNRFVPGAELGSLMLYNLTYYDYGEFQCRAVTPVHSIMASTFLSIEGPPGQPGGLQTLASSGKNIYLEFSDGAYNGQPIASYDVEGRTLWNSSWVVIVADIIPRPDPQSGRRRVEIVGNMLSPWSQYDFRVIAKNGYGKGIPSDPSPAHSTMEDRPFKYPDNIGGGGGNVGDLTITWTPLPPQDQNAPGVWYKIFYKPLESGESDYRFEEVRGNTNGLKVVRIGEKNYYRKYTVKVQAHNRRGNGPMSPEVEVFSAEDRPNAVPVQVAAYPLNSTCLNVTWLPIEMTRENIRGKLIGYRIKYWRDGYETADDATYKLSRDVVNQALIVGLMNNTYYWVVAMAFNGAGSGTESEPFKMRTFKSAPIKPPTSVNVEALTPHSILVTWRASSPSQEEEPIEGFKIRYWDSDQDFSTYTDVVVWKGGQNMMKVQGLSPGKIYKLRVLAFSMGGDGRMSSPAWEFQLGDADTLRGGVPGRSPDCWLLFYTFVLMTAAGMLRWQ